MVHGSGGGAAQGAARQHPRQISLDVHYVVPDNEQGGSPSPAVSPEAMAKGLEAGDRVIVDFVLGAAAQQREARSARADEIRGPRLRPESRSLNDDLSRTAVLPFAVTAALPPYRRTARRRASKPIG